MANEITTKTNDTQMIQMSAAKQNLSVFSNADSFQLACKMAESLSKSTIVPKAYQNNQSNCMIAIEMASRINTSPMMVMQNLYIVNGTPAWSSQWIIAMINNSHRYKTELKFDLQKDQSGRPISCTAWAEDYNGNVVVGPTITMEMAEKEGWINKAGSKWKTMPEVMIRYRAASFFGRLNCPDMIMGIYSQEEVIDGFGEPVEEAVAVEIPQRPEEERVITQEERQMFMTAIADNFEDRDTRNKVYKAVLAEIGITSTNGMNVGQLGQALAIVERIAEEWKNGEMETDVEEDNPNG